MKNNSSISQELFIRKYKQEQFMISFIRILIFAGFLGDFLGHPRSASFMQIHSLVIVSSIIRRNCKAVKSDALNTSVCRKTYAGQPVKSGAAARTSRPELIFTKGNPISRRKNRNLADFAPGNPKDFSKIW